MVTSPSGSVRWTLATKFRAMRRRDHSRNRLQGRAGEYRTRSSWHTCSKAPSAPAHGRRRPRQRRAAPPYRPPAVAAQGAAQHVHRRERRPWWRHRSSSGAGRRARPAFRPGRWRPSLHARRPAGPYSRPRAGPASTYSMRHAPISRCRRLNSARVSWRSFASRLVSGSSSSSSEGRRTSARPIATRCCSRRTACPACA